MFIVFVDAFQVSVYGVDVVVLDEPEEAFGYLPIYF